MFTSKDKRTELPMAAEPAPKRPTPSRIMTSIIANGVKIQGSLLADGAEVQVDGEIDGNVRGGSLTIGDTGFVRGDIVSESVTVNGRVEGSLRARKVTLARTAHVMGDITHQQLSVEMGAVFEGQCRYVQDPLKSDAPSGAPALSGPAQTSQATMVAQSVDAEPADHALGGVVVSEAR
jgi:cytoskeletal protein CcmA (bactofilin family)